MIWLMITAQSSMARRIAEEKVLGLGKDIKVLKEKGQVALTERQLKEMSKLEKLEVVKLVGKDRGAHYVLR